MNATQRFQAAVFSLLIACVGLAGCGSVRASLEPEAFFDIVGEERASSMGDSATAQLLGLLAEGFTRAGMGPQDYWQLEARRQGLVQDLIDLAANPSLAPGNFDRLALDKLYVALQGRLLEVQDPELVRAQIDTAVTALGAVIDEEASGLVTPLQRDLALDVFEQRLLRRSESPTINLLKKPLPEEELHARIARASDELRENLEAVLPLLIEEYAREDAFTERVREIEGRVNQEMFEGLMASRDWHRERAAVRWMGQALRDVDAALGWKTHLVDISPAFFLSRQS